MAESSADACVLLHRRVIAAGPPARVMTVAMLRTTFGTISGHQLGAENAS
jgi:hypothetical protein